MLGTIEEARELVRRLVAGRAESPAWRLDGATLRALLALLVVWSGCLWVLGVEAMGFCWAASVELAAAELAAFAAALAIPNQIVNLVFSLSARLHSPAALSAQMAVAGQEGAGPSGPRHPRGLLRLLSAAAVGCALGGLATTAGILAAPRIVAWLGWHLLLPAWAWSIGRFGLAWLIMLPMALASCALVLTGSLLRRCGPDDPYRLLARDLTWAAGAGMIVLAAMWLGGVNLLGVALACPALIAAGALATAARGSTGIQAARPAEGVAPLRRRRRQRWMNLLEWAVLGWLLVLQCRLLRDATGAGWWAGWLWLALTATVMALAGAREDRSARPIGRTEAGAAVAGMIVVASIQMAELTLAFGAAARARWLWVALAAAAQVFLAALASTVMTRRRRLHAGAGFPARYWLADAAGGTALGALAALVALAGHFEAPSLTALALVGIVVVGTGARPAAQGERGRRGDLARRLALAGVGAAAVLGMACLFVGAARAVCEGLGGRLIVGASLTAIERADGRIRVPGSAAGPEQTGPMTALVDRLVDDRRQRWWLVVTDVSELPPDVRAGAEAGAHLVVAPYAVLARPAERRGRPGGEAFVRAVTVRALPFDGILLSGLGADHPEAWCLYNRELLGRCRGLLNAGGKFVLWTSAPRSSAGRLSAVAETVRSVFGRAGVAIQRRSDTVETLVLAGGRGDPAEALARLAAGLDVEVAPADRPGAGAGEVRSLTVRSPGR